MSVLNRLVRSTDTAPIRLDVDVLRPHLLALAPPIGAALIVYLAYLFTHPYPGLGGGLFSTMAEQIRSNGYHLPTRIPHYTRGGIPFGYPPLGFYAMAALMDLADLGPLTLTRVVPGLVAFAYVIAAYALAYELLGSRLEASVTGIVVATSPMITTMQITAGGIVRAPAFLLMTVGLYVGVKLFRTHRVRWLTAAVLCVTLLTLTHPTHTVSLAYSYLFLFVALDRSAKGLAFGTVTAAVPLLLTSPWWLTVVSRHGVDLFLQTSGSHGGLGLQPLGPIKFWYVPDAPFPLVWRVLVVLGGLYLLSDRNFVLPAWMAFVLLVFPGRISMLVGGMIVAVGVTRAARSVPERVDVGRSTVRPSVLFVAVLCLAGVGTGVLHAADYPGLDDSHSTPMFVDDDDLSAMEWARTETGRDAEFVVVGDANEWFPLFAHRTTLVSSRGTEWQGADARARHVDAEAALAGCDDASCLTRVLAELGLDPDFVYVPKGEFSAGTVRRQSTAMRDSLVTADDYQIAYENSDVVIVRVTDR